MFVLFLFGAIKQIDDRNHFRVKKRKKKEKQLLCWKASESPLVTRKGS